jgi:excinuclease ABC subunit A
VVAEGTPEEVAVARGSHTGRHLGRVLRAVAARDAGEGRPARRAAQSPAARASSIATIPT